MDQELATATRGRVQLVFYIERAEIFTVTNIQVAVLWVVVIRFS
jgi:hypothetical protein